MVSGRKLIYFGRNFDGPLLRLDTDSSSVNFCIFPPDLGLHKYTVGVALDSHIAERKPSEHMVAENRSFTLVRTRILSGLSGNPLERKSYHLELCPRVYEYCSRVKPLLPMKIYSSYIGRQIYWIYVASDHSQGLIADRISLYSQWTGYM